MRTTADATPRYVEGSYFTLGGDPAALVLQADQEDMRPRNIAYGITRADGSEPYWIEVLEGRRFAFDDYDEQDSRLYDTLYGTAR